MEDWEIELMQTPNTISSYMMGEYQRMKYRRKYRSSNKVVEPEYITGALNYSMVGSIEKGLNFTKFKEYSPVSRAIDAYNIAVAKDKGKEAYKAVMGWGSGEVVLGVSKVLGASANVNPIIAAAGPYIAAGLASYYFAEWMGKAYEEAPVWAKTKQGQRAMNEAKIIQKKQLKGVRSDTLSPKAIQSNLNQYGRKKRTGLDIIRHSQQKFESSYQKSGKWRKTAEINNNARYQGNNFSKRQQAISRPTKSQTNKSIVYFDRMIKRQKNNVKNYWTKRVRGAENFIKKHFGFFKRIKKNANGSFVSGPMLSWVGEDGPEVIIPLSRKKKDRGLELWKQAGDILGASENSQDIQRSNSSNKKNKQKVSVSVKNITISDTKNEREKNSIDFNMLREQKEEISDELCNILAESLESAYQNISAVNSVL